MDSVFLFFLILHVAGGATALLAGSVNILSKKGGRRHKIVGKIFVYGMLTAGFSGLVLSVLHPNYFLFMVAIFTLYMVATGSRYIALKMNSTDQKPRILDWILTISMALSGFFLIGLGVSQLLKPDYFGLVYITFGFFGFIFVKSDVQNYNGRFKAKNYWLLEHISRMTGGFIASVTAFLVVNEQYFPIHLPGVFVWLLPSLVLVPFIILWSRKYGVIVKTD